MPHKEIDANLLKNSKSKNSCFSTKLKLNKIIAEHKSYIGSVILTNDGRLASSSADKTIKIFDLENFNCEITIEEHSDFLSSISMLKNGYLILSGFDRLIKILEVNKRHYQCIKTLRGHQSWVIKTIELSNNTIASCSGDKTIKIWNTRSPFNCIKTLVGHSGWVNSILELTNNKYVLSGDFENNLIVWKTGTFEKVKMIKNIFCSNKNSLKEIKENKVLIGGQDQIAVFDTNFLQIEVIINFNGDVGCIYSFIELNDGSFLCGTSKGKFISITNNEYKISSAFDAHEDSIHSLVMIKKNIFISCSDDTHIKIWEIN